jgi:4'-phosphopantetheinyl transferase
LKYRLKDDQKRAVVSQVLQRACASRLLGEDWQQVDLQRTKGSKPFYAGSKCREDAPNFNYNVSHEVSPHPALFFFMGVQGHDLASAVVK